jgi:hypothetical protein
MSAPKYFLGETVTCDDGPWMVTYRRDTDSVVQVELVKIPDGEDAYGLGRTWFKEGRMKRCLAWHPAQEVTCH